MASPVTQHPSRHGCQCLAGPGPPHTLQSGIWVLTDEEAAARAGPRTLAPVREGGRTGAGAAHSGESDRSLGPQSPDSSFWWSW